VAEKNDVVSIFKMVDLSHFEFCGSNNGFFEKPNYVTSYMSSIETIAQNPENRIFAFWRQDPRWRRTWILGSNNGFFEKPMYDFL